MISYNIRLQFCHYHLLIFISLCMQQLIETTENVGDIERYLQEKQKTITLQYHVFASIN